MARKSYRSITSIYPSQKTERRIKIPQSTWRPVSLRARDLIRTEYLKEDIPEFVTHRRGLQRPKIGEDPLEARAVSKDSVRGTLPERIVYKSLVKDFHFAAGADFDFQCLAGHHRVLTKDFRWIPIRDLKVGDEILNCGEDSCHENRRSWEIGTVIHNKPSIEDTYRVKLSDETEIVCTAEHPWLIHNDIRKYDRGKNAKLGWTRTDKLRVGDYVPKYVDVWEESRTYEAGYIAGFFDGEGSIVQSKTQTGGHAMNITIGQNKDAYEWQVFQKMLEKEGIEFTIYDYSGKYKRSYDDGTRNVVQARIPGGRSSFFKFLGTIRPSKLYSRLDYDKLGKFTKMEDVQIISIEPNGKQEIYKLAVDNKTYIAEGFAMHNSSLQGGRMELGGIVADFLFPILKLVIQVQGPTHTGFLRHAKDEEQRLALEEMGYDVVGVDLDVIYNEGWFDNWMRRLFGFRASGSGSGHVPSPYGWSDDDIDWTETLELAIIIDNKLDMILV